MDRSGSRLYDMPQFRKPFEVVLVAARAAKMPAATILPPQRRPATEPPIGPHRLTTTRSRIPSVESIEPSLDMRFVATAEVPLSPGLRGAPIIPLAFVRQRH
jgi:hypothetical protein